MIFPGDGPTLHCSDGIIYTCAPVRLPVALDNVHRNTRINGVNYFLLISFFCLLSLGNATQYNIDTIKRAIKEYYDRITKLEDQKFDLEYVVKKKDFEVRRSSFYRLAINNISYHGLNAFRAFQNNSMRFFRVCFCVALGTFDKRFYTREDNSTLFSLTVLLVYNMYPSCTSTYILAVSVFFFWLQVKVFKHTRASVVDVLYYVRSAGQR